MRKSSFIGNTSWIIGSRIAQMVLGLIVASLTARYLGPSNFGLINYAAAFANFFTCFCTLGINGILVKELLDKKEQNGELLGSAIVLRLASSALSLITITLLVAALNPDEPTTIVVAALHCMTLIFQAFDTIGYWYQSQLMSRVSSICSLIGYVAMSVYKIFLLATQKSIEWFAVSNALDTLIIGLLLVITYIKFGEQKLRFTWKTGKYLLANSYHFILSGLAVAVYGQISSILLKHMMDETAVAFFTSATSISGLWAFVLSALIDSARPIIVESRAQSMELYRKRLVQLYSAVLYLSFAVAIAMNLFGDVVIRILYGESYMPAMEPLRILTWYTGFSYLGVARSIWLVCEGKQRYEKILAMLGAITSVVLNVVLIPLLGIRGAAVSALLTQLSTNFLYVLAFKPLRENGILILRAFNPKNLIDMVRMAIKK